jgi:hypothetical protein
MPGSPEDANGNKQFSLLMSRHLFSKKENSLETELMFKSLAERYCAIVSNFGIRRKPYSDPSTPIFRAADPTIQKRALVFLENSLAVFDEASLEKDDLRDNQKLIWRLLSKLKMAPPADIFDKMDAEDVVEIFNISDGSHAAWNLRLMDFVSFTLEQLLCVPWSELGARPPAIMAKIGEIIGKIASNEICDTLDNPIPLHAFTELNSELRFSAEVLIKHVAPLRQAGRNVGFMSITRGRALDPLPKPDNIV